MSSRTVIEDGVTFRVDSEIGWAAGANAGVQAIEAPLSYITTGQGRESVDAFLLTAPLLIFSGAVAPVAGPAEEIAKWQLGIAQNVTAYERVANYTNGWTVTEAFQTESQGNSPPPLRDGQPGGIPFSKSGAALQLGQRTDIAPADSQDAPTWKIPWAMSDGSTLASTAGNHRFATWLMLARLVDPPEERKIILLGRILWRVNWTTVMQGAAPVFQGPVTALIQVSMGLDPVVTAANLPALGDGSTVPDLRAAFDGNDYVFGTLDHQGEVRRWCYGEDGAAAPFVQRADPNLSPSWLTAQGGQGVLHPMLSRRVASAPEGSARSVVPAPAVASGGGTVLDLEVAANVPWVDTGLMVGGDLAVSLRPTSGSWTANPATGMVGAAGHPGLIAKPGYVLPGALEGVLVGQVGATVFPIEDSVAIPAGATGRLYLSINDDMSDEYGAGFADNEGSLTVEITVASRGGSSGETEPTWLEIVLVGEDGRGIAAQRYVVTLPGGTPRTGFLDKDGRARLDDLSPGHYQVSFPDLDGEAWQPADG
jgi:hypothetical protein